jgi:predicted RNA-binding Zn-ribbon protein involved in translation (DUF1610 family)
MLEKQGEPEVVDTQDNGTCPSCGTRIGFWQAALKGKGTPFACRNCGTQIQKSDAEFALALGAFIAFWAVRTSTDSFLYAAVVFLVICALIPLRSQRSASIELARPDSAGSKDAA